MIADIFFPKVCLACGFLGSYICLACERKLKPIFAQDVCLYCDKKSYLGYTHPSCLRKDGIDGVLSIFYYDETIRSIIRNIKYKGVFDSFREFFLLMNNDYLDKYYFFKKIYKNQCLQPIPLHPNKLKKRGFNQSDYICKFFSYFLQYETTNLLIRSKETTSQAQTRNRRERQDNMKNAFSVPFKKEMPPSIILIDDIVTTGATIKEAAKVLKQSGAHRVFAFSLARG